MPFFVPAQTSSHEITSPDGETASIEIRQLNAGDVASIHDSIRLSTDAEPEVKLGAFRFAMVEAALVSWSLPEDLTPNTLRQLEPIVFDQIYQAVNSSQDESPLDETS